MQKTDYFGTFLDTLSSSTPADARKAEPAMPPAADATTDVVLAALARRADAGEMQVKIEDLVKESRLPVSFLLAAIETLQKFGMLSNAVTAGVLQLTDQGREVGRLAGQHRPTAAS